VDVAEFGAAQITVALIDGASYADLRWGDRYRGTPLLDTQALEFPRSYLYNRYGTAIEGLPEDIKTASIIYTLESLNGTLYPADASTAKNVKKEVLQVGPIKVESEYQGSATASTPLGFPLADRLCKKFTESSNFFVKA
jgi:hypothetical protein